MRTSHAIGALGAVAAAGALGHGLRGVLTLPDQAMVLLLAVVAAAALGGRVASLVAVFAAVATFNFLFVPPLYTFEVADLQYVVTFAVMLVVGVVVGDLTARVREQAAIAAVAENERLRNELLSAVGHDLRTPLASITGSATALLAGGL